MTYDTSVFLLVLPELNMLVHVNVLLIFAMLFAAPALSRANVKVYELKPALTPRHSESGLGHAYDGSLVTPTLQTEAVAKLAVVALACTGLVLTFGPLTLCHGYGLIHDPLGLFMSVFLILGSCASITLSLYSWKRYSRYEFILILMLSLIGMIGTIKSYSFLTLYLSVELQSLSFYLLAAMRCRTESSAEAGLKYFILSAFSSAMLLLGMALVYSAHGSLTFSDLALLCEASVFHSYGITSVNVGLGCICISLLFKLGSAPFHAWIADVYEGSHTSITSWFAITAKIAVMTALIRLCSIHNMAFLLTLCAAVSLVVGSLSAMRQVKLKRLVAFSAVANAGWFLLGLACGNMNVTIIHLMVYTLLSVNLFSVIILPLYRDHPSLGYRTRILKAGPSAKGSNVDVGAESGSIKYISDLHQIAKVNPCLGFAVCLSMFSLAGIPPLAGFYSKYLIISAVTQSEMYLVLALALGVAVISAFYYLRVVKTLYFGTSGGEHGNMPWFSYQPLHVNAYLTSITSFLTLGFFAAPDYFIVMLSFI